MVGSTTASLETSEVSTVERSGRFRPLTATDFAGDPEANPSGTVLASTGTNVTVDVFGGQSLMPYSFCRSVGLKFGGRSCGRRGPCAPHHSGRRIRGLSAVAQEKGQCVTRTTETPERIWGSVEICESPPNAPFEHLR
jgi:hypothetical protein